MAVDITCETTATAAAMLKDLRGLHIRIGKISERTLRILVDFEGTFPVRN